MIGRQLPVDDGRRLQRLDHHAGTIVGVLGHGALPISRGGSRCPPAVPRRSRRGRRGRSEEHTSELQSLMRISYAVFCLKKKKTHILTKNITHKKVYNRKQETLTV